MTVRCQDIVVVIIVVLPFHGHGERIWCRPQRRDVKLEHGLIRRRHGWRGGRLLGVQYFGTYLREESFSCFLPRVSILPFQPPIILSRNIAISSGKYEARIAIFRIFAAVDRFSQISWKVGKPLKKIKFCVLMSFS